VNRAASNSTTVQDYEVQVLGSRETRITRIGFRETSRRSEAWAARQVDPNDWEPGSDRTPVPCDISSTSLVAPTRWVTSYWQLGGRRHARSF
jgi:hypothetical protein